MTANTRAAAILSRKFTLVATNVPYLGHGRQDPTLKRHCTESFPDSKTDLATCMLERCIQFLSDHGTAALVSPQAWLFIGPYKALRTRLLRQHSIEFIAQLGPGAFQTITGEIVNVNLVAISRGSPPSDRQFVGFDASASSSTEEKARAIAEGEFSFATQKNQLANPDARIVVAGLRRGTLLTDFANSYKGIATGDMCRFIRFFWETQELGSRWASLQGSLSRHDDYGGREQVILWEDGKGELYRFAREKAAALHNVDRRGEDAWGKDGIAVSQMAGLSCSIYRGDFFDENTAVVVPKNAAHLEAMYCFMQSKEYAEEVRKLDSSSLKIPNLTLIKVPFDLGRWQTEAASRYSAGLPAPTSNDPTQVVFDGSVGTASHPLQVAVCALMGFCWPRQTGARLHATEPVALNSTHVDDEGIACLSPVRGERSAADRVRALLADVFRAEWSSLKLSQLLDDVGYHGKSLEEWLRDGFFEQHCEVFQNRPFVWHVSDGVKDGFSALLNYHTLAAPNGEGKRTLEKLIYTYLGDWIDRQRADQKAGVEGADGRVAAAEHLKRELEKIRDGEPPYDIFVRWKPLHQQPVGWDPDIDDGVRLNIRPFMIAKPLNARAMNACILRVRPKIKWDKDRGKDPSRTKEEYPWFWGSDGQAPDFSGASEFDGVRWNDLHYSRSTRLAARERARGEKS